MGDDSRQYGFEVESGADYLADFAEGFELAYRACQFVGSLIQFFEQADVLDGDHRLVGEGFEQLDLLSVKGRTSVRRIIIAPMDLPSRTKAWQA